MGVLDRLLIVVAIALLLATGLCLLDDDGGGDLCFALLAVTLHLAALVRLICVGRVTPLAIAPIGLVPQRFLRSPI